MNMDTFGRLTAPASAKFRQLQKMVQDIKKNDGSLLDKLRRLKSKPTPKVPARDYQGDDADGDEQWSEAEFESDTYEDPLEDQDDSYEPPPSHRVFPPTPSVSFSRGEYVDSCRNRPNQPPRKPLRPAMNTKPLPPEPRPRADDDDDEDYINPDSDDNYIDPTEKPPPNPLMHDRTRAVKTSPLASKPVPQRPISPDLYEVPDHEENSPPVSRLSTIHGTPSQSLPPRASPRMIIRRPSIPVQEPPETDDECEFCHNGTSIKSEEDPVPVLPKPKPREKQPKPVLKPRPDLKHKESEGPTVPTRHSSNQKHSATAPPMDFKRPKIPLPQLFTSHRQAHRGRAPTENISPDTEKEADLYQKPWYARACDRKTAEDALILSNKDGSFLVRKSSGQDTGQPYTLVVFYNNRVYNIPVRYVQTSQQYALGREKRGEERFSSVSQIIENHQRNPLVLIDTQSNTKDAAKLCYPVRP